MFCIIVLLYVHHVVVEFYDSSSVVIDVAVIRRRKNSYHEGKFTVPTPFIKLVSINLRFMRSDDTEQVVLFKKFRHSFSIEVEGTASGGVRFISFRSFAILGVNRISPEYVTIETLSRRLLKTIHRINII